MFAQTPVTKMRYDEEYASPASTIASTPSSVCSTSSCDSIQQIKTSSSKQIDFMANTTSWNDLITSKTTSSSSSSSLSSANNTKPTKGLSFVDIVTKKQSQQTHMNHNDSSSDDDEHDQQTSTTTATYDPELDCSRDGLPLMFKQSSLQQQLESVHEEHKHVEIIEDTNSRGQKRTLPTTPTTSHTSSTSTTSSAANSPVEQTTLTIKTQVDSIGFTAFIPASTPSRAMIQKKQKLSTTTATTTDEYDEEDDEHTQTPAQKITLDSFPLISDDMNDTIHSDDQEEHTHDDEDDDNTPTSHLIQVVKKAKGVAPRVLDDEERIKQRQKQIDLGKRTAGYQNYIKICPKSERKHNHNCPRTPNIHKNCSKRSWDGQVRQWRRSLHQYDPKPASE